MSPLSRRSLLSRDRKQLGKPRAESGDEEVIHSHEVLNPATIDLGRSSAGLVVDGPRVLFRVPSPSRVSCLSSGVEDLDRYRGYARILGFSFEAPINGCHEFVPELGSPRLNVATAVGHFYQVPLGTAACLTHVRYFEPGILEFRSFELDGWPVRVWRLVSLGRILLQPRRDPLTGACKSFRQPDFGFVINPSDFFFSCRGLLPAGHVARLLSPGVFLAEPVAKMVSPLIPA